MQDNAIKQYKNINEKIQVPVSLKEDTIKLMKEGKQRRRYTGFAYAAAAIAGIVFIGIASLQIRQKSNGDITICEALDANTVKEEVELSKGDLYFQNIQGEYTSPGLSLGGLEGKSVSVSEEEYFSYLGTEPLPEYIPQGMVKQDLGKQQLTLEEDGSYGVDLFTVRYEGAGESYIEILLSGKKVPKAEEAAEILGNLVNETDVKIAYYGSKPEETVFIAYFQTEVVGYRIKTKGVSQEEFIKIILSFIK